MWFLDDQTIQAVESMRKSGLIPTEENMQHFQAIHEGNDGFGVSRILSLAGNQAEIAVKGVITLNPDVFAMMFGGGNITYGEIISALAQADADPNIEKIVLRVDSPGGEIDGLFDLLDSMRAVSTPIEAFVENNALSAAYAIVAQADSIVAANVMTRVGSIGIITQQFVSENEITITSSKAPGKAPDASTPEGLKIITQELDAAHKLFVEAIASGRNTTVANVNSNFGRGAILQAREAMDVGMIDSIAKPALRLIEPGQPEIHEPIQNENMEERAMDARQFQAEHPDIFNQAVEQGVNAERERCTAHLIYGEQSGDMVACAGYIKDGSEITPAVQAQYMTSGFKKMTLGSRDADDDAAALSAGAIQTPAAEVMSDETKGQRVMAMASESLGYVPAKPAVTFPVTAPVTA